EAHSRYHITTRPAPPPPGGYPVQFHTTDGDAYVKYGKPVFHGSNQRGDAYWTAEIITQTWYQAETGRIPISGAGYGGKFAGEGFDGIWLDMSEIVRPTRDGIHGREYISTQVDLGGRLVGLHFDGSGRLLSQLPNWLSLPIPVLFNPLPMPLPTRNGVLAVARAAQELGTLALLEVGDWDEDVAPAGAALAPRLTSLDELAAVPAEWQPHYIEVDSPDPLPLLEAARSRWPQAVIGVCLPLESDAAGRAIALVEAGVGVLHLQGDEEGQDLSGQRHLPDAICDVHLALVGRNVRDRVSLVVSGGICEAEE